MLMRTGLQFFGWSSSRLLLLGLCTLSACAGADEGGPGGDIGGGATASPRSVILISIDSLRADHLGCYGYRPPTSPRIDAFAAQGVRFTRAWATSPWTLPSHASMFTGLYPDTHGLAEESVSLKPGAATLAGHLRAAGFRTSAVVCAPLLRKDFGLDEGFELYDDELIGDSFIEARTEKVGPAVTEKALTLLDRMEGRPFFMFLHYWDVHYDYNPPAALTEIFDPGYGGALDGIDIYNRKDIAPGMDPRDLQHLLALYDAEIRYTDDAIGALLDGLSARGLADTTLVVITSDHGEEFLEHGGKGHTHTCYEESVRIPLLMRVPWLDAAQPVIDEPASLIDLAPTILELLGVQSAGAFFQGKSLVPTMRDGTPLKRKFLMTQTVRGKHAMHGARLIWTSLIGRDSLKLHQFLSASEASALELYDLAQDPLEQLDLSNQRVEPRNQLGGMLRGLQQRHMQRRQILGATVPRKEDSRLTETLKGLGYGDF